MAKKRRKGGSKRFYSKKQWRWAFATKKPWARRHAHKTPGPKKVRYRRLPTKSTGATRAVKRKKTARKRKR